ncbi:MAG: hypothetical protein ABIF11_05240 [Nitrospirota bacterium]
MAVAVAEVGKKEDLSQRVSLWMTEGKVTIERGKDQIEGGIKEDMGISEQRQSPLKRSSLTSAEVEFRKLVHERAKNAPPIEEAWKILDKVDVSLTQMLIEERKNRREKW